MTIHQGSTALLATIPRVFDGVAVEVFDAAGGPAAHFGATGQPGARLRAELPEGALVATVPQASPELHSLVEALLAAVAERERLENDMESMNASSLRLLEQVSMFGETLPRLSAGGDDREIAGLGVRACHRAAGVQQVVYLRYEPAKACCEVVVHFGGDAQRTRGNAVALDPAVPVEGFLADVLAVTEGVVIRRTDAGRRLGAPGSPEHLARTQILGVPVTYGAGDKRVLLGALLLVDKDATYARSPDDVDGTPLDNEEGQIAESFAAMLGAVLGARKSAELKKEMSMAETIQRQILPQRPPKLAGFDVAATCLPCGQVGGDYYDYVPLADGRLLVVIADVSGHNLASGMIMVSACSTLRTLASVHNTAADVFESLAHRMYGDLTRFERFLTAAAVAVRGDDGAVEYVSAGHNDLFVYRAASGRVERVASESTILGFVPSPAYAARNIDLSPGDCLLLYTDGITEAVDEGGEMFGEDRLAEVFARLAADGTARRILDGIVRELDTFRRGEVGTDDVTAVVLKYGGQRGGR